MSYTARPWTPKPQVALEPPSSQTRNWIVFDHLELQWKQNSTANSYITMEKQTNTVSYNADLTVETASIPEKKQVDHSIKVLSCHGSLISNKLTSCACSLKHLSWETAPHSSVIFTSLKKAFFPQNCPSTSCWFFSIFYHLSPIHSSFHHCSDTWQAHTIILLSPHVSQHLKKKLWIQFNFIRI